VAVPYPTSKQEWIIASVFQAMLVIWGGDGHRRGGVWKQAGEPKNEEILGLLIEDKHEDLLK
jgi:hypothetical protein